MKGVDVLRECRRTGCRKQCDAEDTAGHPTDNRKNHGTEFVSTAYLENRQPPAIVPLEGHSEGSINPAQVSPEPYDPLQEHSGNYRRNASVADLELGTTMAELLSLAVYILAGDIRFEAYVATHQTTML
jgi:hypothetical protein